MLIGLTGSCNFYKSGTDVDYENVQTHWVVKTEAKYDSIKRKYTLTISSWGEKLEMDLGDFIKSPGIGGGIYTCEIN